MTGTVSSARRRALVYIVPLTLAMVGLLFMVASRAGHSLGSWMMQAVDRYPGLFIAGGLWLSLLPPLSRWRAARRD